MEIFKKGNIVASLYKWATWNFGLINVYLASQSSHELVLMASPSCADAFFRIPADKVADLKEEYAQCLGQYVEKLENFIGENPAEEAQYADDAEKALKAIIQKFSLV